MDIVKRIQSLLVQSMSTNQATATEAAKLACQLIISNNLVISPPTKDKVYTIPMFGESIAFDWICDRCEQPIYKGEPNWFLNKERYHDHCMLKSEKENNKRYKLWLLTRNRKPL